MLERILSHIHNYFEKEIVRGNFKISSNSIDLPFLQEGQYFRIIGSVFNDGIHEYPASNLVDEEFRGEIWAMAVPPVVIALSLEIKDWVASNGTDGTASPFTSESFGGYSYTRGSKNTSSGANVPIDWTDVFRDRLNQWRKIS